MDEAGASYLSTCTVATTEGRETRPDRSVPIGVVFPIEFEFHASEDMMGVYRVSEVILMDGEKVPSLSTDGTAD